MYKRKTLIVGSVPISSCILFCKCASSRKGEKMNELLFSFSHKAVQSSKITDNESLQWKIDLWALKFFILFMFQKCVDVSGCLTFFFLFNILSQQKGMT